MQIRSCTIEQPDDRYVQVKKFARSPRPDSDLGLGRIDAVPRSSPSSILDQPVPRRRRCDDLPGSLCVKCQRSQRHVSVIAALDHLPHVFDFSRSQSRGHNSRAARLVIQVASSLGTTPAVVARRGESRDSERRIQRQDSSRTFDCSQKCSLGVALRKPLAVEPNFRDAKHGDQQANHRTEQSRSLRQGMHLCNEFGTLAGSEIAPDDIRSTAVNPAPDGRARNLQFGE